MSRGKKRKFNELKSFNNVFEWNDEDFKEKVKNLFKNYDNVILELGCGKGEYAIYLGQKNPDTLVVGIDIQGERIWSGAKYALENGLNNVFFFRMQVENLVSFVSKGSVNEIWLTFPDPFLKERDSKKRLTSPRFLEMYKKILKDEGRIYLKTDSKELYEYTLEVTGKSSFVVVEKISDVYSNEEADKETQTTFEKKHLKEGKKIMRLCFQPVSTGRDF